MMGARRILIVDDDVAMARSVARVLEKQYEVVTATAPGDAVDRARAHDPDLAILDVRMPAMDGFSLMAALREVRPGLDVIFMTGSVHELDAQLIRAIREKAFYFIQKPFDREVLLTLVERCLEQRRLAEENRRYVRRLEEELDEARAFQMSLMPKGKAVIDGVSIAGLYEPSTALGGDFYDFARVGQGRVALFIADVSGHGVTAAMLTGIVKSEFTEACADGFEPADAVRRIAGRVRAFGPERFVTFICARLSRETRTLEYVNAGHPSGLVWGPERDLRRLGPTGPLASMVFPEPEWRQERIELRAGDRVLLYTDGVTEAVRDHEVFGEERLVEIVRTSKERDQAFLAAIAAAVHEFTRGRPRDDDRTLLTAE
jgi:sigma-B regulation protein RsbU (phosphoserine phosphatase)